MSNLTDEQLINEGFKRYQGQKINVYFNSQICQHSGNCVRGNHQVFNLQRRPWIDADGASPQEIIRLVDNCPSGALQYIEKE
jgi:uncharacterized Fe-S cluster protein YjdI